MIYCVEDDESGRELILYALRASGYETEGFASAEEFWKKMKEQTPELIILDIMLPDEDGLSVLKKLRANAQTADIPVLMETARGTEYDKVLGLDLGADDYLAKPFGMMEMLSRVKALLRRSGRQRKDQILKMGRVEMDAASHVVRIDGQEVELTRKEYDLLHLFMSNPGRAFSREMLLTAVWNDDYFGETRTVDVHVGTLRAKLGDEAGLIQTVRGVGYRMEQPDPEKKGR